MNILIIVVFMAVLAGLAYLSLGIGAATLGYFTLVKAKGGTSPAPWIPPKPTGTNWIFQYSANMVPGQTPEDFDFPTTDGVHYCVKNAPALAVGKTIAMTFSITGSGTITPADVAQYPNDPARIRLYMQRTGDNMGGQGQYQQYRYWGPALDIKNGDSTLSTSLDPANWVDVNGDLGSNYPNQFAACVANAGVVGFTFGGHFAGHGVFVKNGTAHFKLNSYTVA